MVVLYDICADAEASPSPGAGPGPGMGADGTNDNNDSNNDNNKEEIEKERNNHNIRQTCSQKYFDYATDRTVDDGYLFVQATTSTNPSKTEIGLDGRPTRVVIDEQTKVVIDEQRPQNKFLYRRDLTSHLGSQIPLHYYTSLEFNTLTIAGRQQRTQVIPLLVRDYYITL